MAWPVLLLARELDLGGSERQMTEIAKTLDRSDLFRTLDAFARKGPPRGTRRHRCAYRSLSGGFVRSFRALSRSVAWQATSGGTESGWCILRLSTYVVRCSGGALGDQRGGDIEPAIARSLIPRKYRPLVRMTDHMADAVVVNCEFVREHLRNNEGVPF